MNFNSLAMIAAVLTLSSLGAVAGEKGPVCVHIHLASLEEVSGVVSELSHNDPFVETMNQSFLAALEQALEDKKLTELDIQRLSTALCFAAEKHKNQTRKDARKTPYIIHPIGVANHLIRVGHVNDPNILIGALLHDTVEDTDTSFEEINALFGDTVEGYVREVTDDKTLPRAERKRLQIVNAPHKSSGAAHIKLADKFYNLNDLLHNPPDWEPEYIDAYFTWASQVVGALPEVNPALKQAVGELLEGHSG